MATITASLFSALDGVVDPGEGEWHFPYFNEEMGAAVTRTHDADVMLFGRVTYDSFAGAWPGREAAGEEDAPFAQHLGDMRKIVASRRPLTFEWRNSEQLDGDLVAAVTALTQDPSIERIALSGSVSVVRQLIDAGLLDELHLFVHPATAGGAGLRLFDEGAPPRWFRLLAATPFETGVVHLVYAPDPTPPTGSYEDAREQLPQD
jgi:dihydrofolate reductase